jgi:hypothetical protein
MNKSEKEVVKKYVEKGYKYLHNGWPDFVFFKVDGDKIVDIKFVEVKLKGDGLRYEQGVMEKIFKSLGLPFEVEFVDSESDQVNPNHVRPNHARPTQSMSIHPNPIHTNPLHTSPGQATSGQTMSFQTIPSQVSPGQSILPQPNPSQTKPIQSKGGDLNEV